MDKDRCMMAVLWILIQNTDKDHIITRNQILRILEDQYDIHIERKYLYKTLEELEDFDFFVIYDVHRKGYYLAKKMFEPGEIVLLCNALHNFAFISMQESDALIKKLQRLYSRFLKHDYNQNIFMPNCRKVESSNLVKWTEIISLAIAKGIKVQFDYKHYNLDKQLVIVNNSPIVVEPRFIIYQDDGPYLVVTGGIHPVMHYRLDKIANLKLTDIKSSPCDWRMDATEYAQQKFFMFSDDNLNVQFCFHKRILDYMIELFGREIMLIPVNGEWIKTTVCINYTGALLLAQQYIDTMVIVYPEDLSRKMRDIAVTAVSRYDRISQSFK